MKIAVVQPYFFPYIGYYQLINAVDKFVIYDDVNFMKKRWINRNNILISGQPSFIIVPIKKISQNKLIKDVEIANDLKWKAKMLKSLEMAYKKAPSFNEAFSLIENVLNRHEPSISKLATASLRTVSEYLEIGTEFVNSSTVYNNSNLKAEERILDICTREGADGYINPIGGTELYSEKNFNDKNIRLNFLKTSSVEYPQFQKDFVPFLSIIDILMFNSQKKAQEFLHQYQLI